MLFDYRSQNTDQLKRLVLPLLHKDVDIFTHLDKKWDISSEQIKGITAISSQVYICKVRISCRLDTWSLVQATYKLLKLARDTGNYSYYCLMTGQDYPIKPIEFIVERLGQSYPKPLVDCTPCDEKNWIVSGFKRIRFVGIHNAVKKITGNRLLRRIFILPVYTIECCITALMTSPIRRLRRIRCELFGGSAWWILPYKIVDDVIEQIDKNTDIVKAFRLKTTPEETFFQTIAMKSRVAFMIDLNPIDAVSQNCLTYTYFKMWIKNLLCILMFYCKGVY